MIRIIVRNCLSWGNFSTKAIEIDPSADIDTLQLCIEEKFLIPKSNQNIKFKRDGYTVMNFIFSYLADHMIN